MTPADHARNAAISLEAKKDALAQRQNGDWKVSFTVQGIDMDHRLTQAPMGTRFAMVLVEIGEDETPVNRKEGMPDNQSNADTRPHPDSSPRTRPDGAKRMDWRDVQPAAQAGIRCGERGFAVYLRETRPNDWIEAEGAADCVRLICGVVSRSELSTNHKARVLWHQLDTEYQAWQAKERVGA